MIPSTKLKLASLLLVSLDTWQPSGPGSSWLAPASNADLHGADGSAGGTGANGGVLDE